MTAAMWAIVSVTMFVVLAAWSGYEWLMWLTVLYGVAVIAWWFAVVVPARAG